MKNRTVVLHLESHPVHERLQVEERIARALRGVDAASAARPVKLSDVDASSRDLLQLAWDRAVREID